MRLQTIIIVLLAVVFGVSAAIGVRLYVKSQTSPWSESVEVMVAARDVPRYATISAADVRTRAVPKDLVPSGALTKLEDALDRSTVNMVGRGEVIVDRDLAKKGIRGIAVGVPEGMRAITIRTPDVSTGVAGFTLPGSKVDVLLTVRNWGTSDPAGAGATITLLQNAEVLAVDQRVESPGELKVDAEHLRSVTLLVTPEQAAKIELGQTLGILHLTLRNPHDTNVATSPSVTLREIRLPSQSPTGPPPASAPRNQTRDWLDALAKLGESWNHPAQRPARPVPPDIRVIRGNQIGWVDMK